MSILCKVGYVLVTANSYDGALDVHTLVVGSEATLLRAFE
jgi:hypothetical protein